MKRTGLSRTSQLARRTALARSEKRLERRTRMRRRGKRGLAQKERMDGLRPVVFERAQQRCEAKIVTVCSVRAVHAHHVLPRARGGRDRLDNLIAVCADCHGWIHRHPTRALELGLLESGRRP